MAPITYGHDMPQPKRTPKPKPKDKPTTEEHPAEIAFRFMVGFLGI